MARFFAAVISHAPGLSGVPLRGHRSSATTHASCVSSSAKPTLRSILASFAMILADSIRQMAPSRARTSLSAMSCATPAYSKQGPTSRTSTVAQAVAGHCFAMAIASSREPQVSRKKPPIISLVSANGPSTTTDS